MRCLFDADEVGYCYFGLRTIHCSTKCCTDYGELILLVKLPGSQQLHALHTIQIALKAILASAIDSAP